MCLFCPHHDVHVAVPGLSQSFILCALSIIWQFISVTYNLDRVICKMEYHFLLHKCQQYMFDNTFSIAYQHTWCIHVDSFANMTTLISKTWCKMPSWWQFWICYIIQRHFKLCSSWMHVTMFDRGYNILFSSLFVTQINMYLDYTYTTHIILTPMFSSYAFINMAVYTGLAQRSLSHEPVCEQKNHAIWYLSIECRMVKVLLLWDTLHGQL